jgi:folate-dependent phosphoribosylglycinamide formyltransferase PurN/GNAT superfamily N-acetyltransferase
LTEERLVSLIVELDDARLEGPALHHELEALDGRGIRPLREHRTPERLLGWIDAEFGGVWSSIASAGGSWWAEDADGPIGFCAFDPRGLDFRWLRRWQAIEGLGVAGPLGVVASARGRGLGATLLRGALFALRERGYRQALIPAVDAAYVPFYTRACGARVAEPFDAAPREPRARTTVLASGNGTNFQAVVDGALAGELPLEVTTLIVNRAGAFARERARAAGVAEMLVVREGESRAAYDERLMEAVAATQPDLVLLLGWMHVLPPPFVARFPQLLNLHPAFLPLDPSAGHVTLPDGTRSPVYRGGRAVDAALEAGAAWIGASVHRVTAEVDRGEVMARAPLRLVPGEAREDLETRLHELERRVLRLALRRWTWERPI